MQKYLLAFLLSFLSVYTFSQEKNDTDSALTSSEIIQKAISLEDSGRYQEAVKELNTIDESDSNYINAQYEKCVALEADSQYEKVIEIAGKWVEKYNKAQNQFYNALANSYDDLKQHKKAQFYYLEALKKYPANYLLYYNLAISYYSSKKTDKAIETLEKSIQLNIYHATGHLMLGLICAKQGKFAQAVMPLEMYLLINPNGSRAKYVLSVLGSIANNNLKLDSVKVKNIDFETENFSDINLIIKSKIALNDNFKTGVRINDPIISQTKALIDKLPKYEVSDLDSNTGFWTAYYVPIFDYFKKKPKAFEPFVMDIASSVRTSNKKIDKYLKHHRGKINRTLKSLNNIYLKIRYNQFFSLNGKEKLVRCVFYNDNRLFSYGKAIKGKKSYFGVGFWHFYGEKGNLIIEGKYDDKGNETGKWKYYNDDGSLDLKKTKDF